MALLIDQRLGDTIAVHDHDTVNLLESELTCFTVILYIFQGSVSPTAD